MRKFSKRGCIREAELQMNDVNETNISQNSDLTKKLNALIAPVSNSNNSDSDFSKLDNIMPQSKRSGSCRGCRDHLQHSASLIEHTLNSIDKKNSDHDIINLIKALSSKGLIKLNNKKLKNLVKNKKYRPKRFIDLLNENEVNLNQGSQVTNNYDFKNNPQTDANNQQSAHDNGGGGGSRGEGSFLNYHARRNLGSLRDAVLNINEANETKESQKADLDNNYDFTYNPQEYSNNKGTDFQDIESQQRKIRDAILKINEVNETNNDQVADYDTNHNTSYTPQDHSNNSDSNYSDNENIQQRSKRFAKIIKNSVNEVNKKQDAKYTDMKDFKIKPMSWSNNTGVDSSDIENQLRYALLKINDVNETNLDQKSKYNSNTKFKYQPMTHSNNSGSDFQDIENVQKLLRDAILKINEVNETTNKHEADIDNNKDFTYAPQDHSGNKDSDFQNIQNQQPQDGYSSGGGGGGSGGGPPAQYRKGRKIRLNQRQRNRLQKNKNKKQLLRGFSNSSSSSSGSGNNSSSSSNSSRSDPELGMEFIDGQLKMIDKMLKQQRNMHTQKKKSQKKG